MGMSSIICLGNRYIAGDDLGCRVFNCLSQTPRPPGIEVVDGGLCGLDLLSLMEGKTRVVFADALLASAAPGRIVVLDGGQVAAQASSYGHSAGLPFLLRMMPHAVSPPWPQVALVGADGDADSLTVSAVANRCLEIACHGLA